MIDYLQSSLNSIRKVVTKKEQAFSKLQKDF
jgi:hypothetical protein